MLWPSVILKVVTILPDATDVNFQPGSKEKKNSSDIGSQLQRILGSCVHECI